MPSDTLGADDPLVVTVVAALSAPSARVNVSRRAEAPRVPGIYAWWSQSPSLLGIAGTPRGDAFLYYVGVTVSKRGLKGRLRQHVRGPLASSTLRRALIALGATAAQPLRTASGKLLLTKYEELALSAWIAESLEVSWHSLDDPGSVEPGVIARMRPPLNVEHNEGHEAWATVAGARRAMSRASSERVRE